MPKNKLKIYPQTSRKPKCVITTPFFFFAGTSSIMAPSGHLIWSNFRGEGYLPDVSRDSWIVEGSLWLGLVTMEHNGLELAN